MMTCKSIDTQTKKIFEDMEKTGIPLLEEKLEQFLFNSRLDLAVKKQEISRQVGFMVDVNSTEDWKRAVSACGKEWSEGPPPPEQEDDLPIFRWLYEARTLSQTVQKSQQIYDLAKGNKDVLRRPFGLYPRYKIGPDGRVATVGELSVEELPKALRSTVCKGDYTIIKAKYPHLELRVLQTLSGDRDLEDDLKTGDPYTAFARRLWGTTGRLSDSDQEIAKVVVQACQSGGGPDQIAEKLRFYPYFWFNNKAEKVAEVYWNNWKGFYPDCVALFEELVQANGHQTVSIFGRVLKDWVGPRSCTYSEESTPADRHTIWFPLQATMIDLVKIGLTNLFDDYRFKTLGGEFLAIWSGAVVLMVPNDHLDKEMFDMIEENLSVDIDPFKFVVKIRCGSSLGEVF